MKWNTFLTFLIIAANLCYGQENRSKADNYFYGYEYQKAIEAYNKEAAKKPLSDAQRLNLADAYFKIGAFENASKIYLDSNKKDTIMSVHRFNKMLQSLSKTSDRERVVTFLKTKSALLSSELLENAMFNYELMEGEEGNLDFTLFNVAINSPQADTSPAFYRDQLLFSSARQQEDKNTYIPTGESYLDIYAASLDENGMANNAAVFSKIPFSKFHKSTPFYSEKQNNIFYILSNTDEGEMAFDDNWKNALAIGVLNSSGQFRFLLKDLSTSFYYPFFDAESDRLYFAANFDDSYGGTDIYYVTTNNGQVMSAPTNLGPRINSPGNEIAPFLFNGSLYFSSDVFYGLGGMDVYKSRIQGRDVYGIPVNLGTGINSQEDDFGFIIKQENEKFTGYFASNRTGGKGKDDIYSFQMNNPPGLKTFALRGRVVDVSSNLGIGKAQLKLLGTNGDLLKELYTNDDGSFTVEVPWEDEITIQSGKGDFSEYSRSYSGKQLEEIQKEPYQIELLQLED